MLSIGESEDIRKIDISWRSGSVNIYTAEQSAQISVKEESTAPLAESEKMVCAIDGDTLRIHFLGDAYRGSYDGEKHLDVGLPRELVSAGHFEEIKSKQRTPIPSWARTFPAASSFRPSAATRA